MTSKRGLLVQRAVVSNLHTRFERAFTELVRLLTQLSQGPQSINCVFLKSLLREVLSAMRHKARETPYTLAGETGSLTYDSQDWGECHVLLSEEGAHLF